MRIVSLLLLCFSLAFANVSYAQSHEMNCPMEQGDSMSNMDHADMPDCCNDAATAAKTGESCKADQDCSISNIVMFFSVPSWNFVSTDRLLARASITFVPTLAPTDLWRPPTLSWSHYSRSVSSCNLIPCLKHLRCICCNAIEFIGSSLCQTYLSEPLCSKVIRHQYGEFTG